MHDGGHLERHKAKVQPATKNVTLPMCSTCKKSLKGGNPYFHYGKVVLCYRCEGRKRKKAKKKPNKLL